MHRHAVTLAVLLAVGAGHVTKAAEQPSAASPSISTVWQLEDDYWRFVRAGDVDRYVLLWHDQFIGWPCGRAHPARKDAIGDWVREVRDKRIAVAVDLTREGAQDFGNIVVVHYRFTRVDTYPDGRVEGRGTSSKITHTWMKVGDTYQIVGGMCGTLPDAAK
jgi:hypothetical protein